ncbi:hypothetical protein BDQ17DRAFT_1367781 [Cyathus striatus]|nr:hypothetical protein BDQ17DRAFT_1367781 [Cyathus striatus]
MSFIPPLNSTTYEDNYPECPTPSATTKPWIYGTIFAGIFYGAITILYVAYVQLMRKQYPKPDLFTRQAIVLLGYASFTFVLCTMTMVCILQKTATLLNIAMCTRSGPDPVVVPGGVGTVGNVCFMLTSWAADALLIWRCIVMYHDLGKRKWLVVAFPMLLQVASIALGSYFCYVLSTTNDDIYVDMIYYESTTLALNAILTVLIVSRLMVLRHRVRQALGTNFGCEYTNIAAMLTESQAMTLVAQGVMLSFIHPGTSRHWALLVYEVLSQVQALAPMLILYRVIQGKAWSSNTFAQITKSKSFGVAWP